jgi:UPF0716 family protein affecting phage T7 exclusion
VIYFLIYLLFEVLVSVNLSSQIGGLNTFFEILLSAITGVVILSNFKSTIVENLRSVSYQKMDMREFQRMNIFTLVGAILLIIPGFLTDIIGVLLQFSVFTTMLVNRISAPKSENNSPYNTSTLNDGRLNQNYNNNQNIKDDDEIIDVEIISDTNTK